MYIYICIYINRKIHVHTYIQNGFKVKGLGCVPVCVYIYIHEYLHTHTHICMVFGSYEGIGWASDKSSIWKEQGKSICQLSSFQPNGLQ